MCNIKDNAMQKVKGNNSFKQNLKYTNGRDKLIKAVVHLLFFRREVVRLVNN